MLVSTARSGVASFTGPAGTKIDAKGRVQAPSDIRRALDLGTFNGFFCYPSLEKQRLECGGPDFVERTKASIAAFDLFDQDREHLQVAILGSMHALMFDQDGRFILPKELRAFLGMPDQLQFVGLGDVFQIWPFEGAEAAMTMHREAARLAIRRMRNPGLAPLPPQEPVSVGPGGERGDR